MPTNYQSPKIIRDYKGRPIITKSKSVQVQNSMIAGPELATVTSPFGKRRHPITKEEQNHSGVDLVGAGILAMDPNIIEDLETTYDEINGLRVKISLTDSRMIYVVHLMTIIMRTSSVGFIIGIMGTSGRSTGLHYHMELWNRGKNESFKLEDPDVRKMLFISL